MQKIKTKYEGVDYWWSGCVYRIVEFGIDGFSETYSAMRLRNPVFLKRKHSTVFTIWLPFSF